MSPAAAAAESAPDHETQPAADASVTLPPPSDDAGGASEPVEIDRQTRADKKAERGALRAALARQEEDMRLVREQIAELRGTLAARPTPTVPEVKSGESDDEKKINEMIAQADRDLALASTTGDKAALERYNDLVMRKIPRETARMEFATLAKTLPKPEAAQSPTKAIIESEYPWLTVNEAARRWAAAAEEQLLAEGRPATLATTREALAAAAAKFKLGGNHVAAGDARRYGGGPSDDDGEGGGPTTVRFADMDKSGPLIRAFANARGISEAEAMKLMAKSFKKEGKGSP